MTRGAALWLSLLLAGPAFGQSASPPPVPMGPKGERGPIGPAGAKGETGTSGAQGSQGTAGPPKRVERYTATSSATGVASFSWSACATAPDIEVLETWISAGPVRIGGAVTASTVSSATVQAYESQGVVLGGQPFKAPTVARSVTIRVVCN